MLRGVTRARQVRDPDTRRGLVALLVTTGGWAAAHVAFLLAPGPGLKSVFYLLGLVVGFAAIGPWLYFCSAYTGRILHRNPAVRRVAVGVFLVVVLVKVTNPIHQLYYTASFLTTPFPHLAIQHGILHWIVMGLSYSLALVGYFMLLELFVQVSYDTTPLVALIGVTGLPVILDIIGLTSSLLIDITYEPLGVAAFAVGVFFVFLARFQAVQLAGDRDQPVIVLDDDDRIREFNESVRTLFPSITPESAIGRRIETVLPRVAARLDGESTTIEFGGGARFHEVASTPFRAGRSRLGRIVTIRDVTDQEQYRRKLERQNERLETFASTVSHDLRNPLTVAKGRVELAYAETGNENLEMAEDALSRMEALIEDLLALTRHGQPVDELEPVRLAAAVEDAWSLIRTGEAVIEIEGDLVLEADPDRFKQLIENLLRNPVEHAAPDVTIRAGPLAAGPGFYIEDDGPGIPSDSRAEVFESGFTTAPDGTGFGLAIVQEIVDAHGWEIGIAAGDVGGARFEIRGVAPPAERRPGPSG